MKNSAQNFIKSVLISEYTRGKTYIQIADDGKPFFRIAWGYAPWGPWWGMN